MSRLKKKAADMITLYHITSAQGLLKIYSDGQISPGGYNNIMSNGADNNSIPSSDQSGVYLLDYNVVSASDAAYYGENAMQNSKISDMQYPDLIAWIKVSVDSSALTADYDDIHFVAEPIDLRGKTKDQLNFEDKKRILDKFDGDSSAKKSIKATGQCVHQGPVFLDSIVDIYLDPSNYRFGLKLESHFSKDQTEMKKLINKIAHEYGFSTSSGKDMSLENAIEFINRVFQEIDNLDNLNKESSISRLKKLNGGK